MTCHEWREGNNKAEMDDACPGGWRIDAMVLLEKVPRHWDDKGLNSRRKRPELFYQPPKEESWASISKRMRRKWWDSRPVFCGICGGRIIWFRDLVPDHIEPGKMGGCKDNSESNLQPAHWRCNREKSSQRNYVCPTNTTSAPTAHE